MPTPPNTPVGVVEPYGVVLVGVLVPGFMVVGVLVDGVVVETGVVGVELVPPPLIQEKKSRSHQIFPKTNNTSN